MLKGVSDELIDLIEQMLDKDPEKRIDNLAIFEHPWIRKYKKFRDDYSDSISGRSERKLSSRTNSDFYNENQVETNFDSDQLYLEAKSPRNFSSQNSNGNSEQENQSKGVRIQAINQKRTILRNNPNMFNIEEHDNETTGNFSRVDLKPKGRHN